MENKHTPGPWHVVPENLSVRDEGSQFVAACLSMEPGQTEQDVANARLISAAPELLEALRKLELSVRNNHSYITLEIRTKEARAVMAKAIGE